MAVILSAMMMFTLRRWPLWCLNAIAYATKVAVCLFLRWCALSLKHEIKIILQRPPQAAIRLWYVEEGSVPNGRGCNRTPTDVFFFRGGNCFTFISPSTPQRLLLPSAVTQTKKKKNKKNVLFTILTRVTFKWQIRVGKCLFTAVGVLNSHYIKWESLRERSSLLCPC